MVMYFCRSLPTEKTKKVPTAIKLEGERGGKALMARPIKKGEKKWWLPYGSPKSVNFNA